MRKVGEFREWIVQLRGETYSNFFLTSNETGDALTVLLDYPLAAISFLRGSDSLSFSASKDPTFEAESAGDYHEFNMDGTPTPIPKGRCVTFDVMEKIVEQIFARGSLPNWIAWRHP